MLHGGSEGDGKSLFDIRSRLLLIASQKPQIMQLRYQSFTP